MEASRQTEHLFVYGTLRSDFPSSMSHQLEKYVVEKSKAYFYGRLFDAGSFPAAIPSEPPHKVYGDLFELKEPDFIISKLDFYEGYKRSHPDQSLFIRKKASIIRKADQTEISAFIYLFNKPVSNLREIPSGDYLAYTEK